MFQHPKQQRSSLSRREFLQRAGMAGIALPSMAAILAACAEEAPSGGGGGGGGGGGLQLARPESPVTHPITDDNPAIADGLAPEAGPLRIIGYPLYIRPGIQNEFKEKFNTSIEYTRFATPEQMVQEMQAHGSDFDLVVTATIENVGKLAFGGLIQPINKSYLPNYEANAWQEVRDPYFDKGQQYTIPYTVYSTGFGYRNDLVTDDLADLDNPYDVFWDPKYAGKVHLLNGARDTLSAALFRMGEDISTEDPTVLEAAKQMLLDGVDTMGWKFDHVDYNELNDQFVVHQTWSGQLTYYIYYLPKGLSIDKFSWVWPPETPSGKPGILATDHFVIPKGAANPVLAHAMINFLYDPVVSLTNYAYEGYQPPINQFDPDQVVADGIVPENLRNTLISQEDLPLGGDPAKVQQYELTPEGTQLYQQIYQEVTGGA